ncbi:hypothetical protein [Pseudonocardia sp. GCM10023141]|uniref:hypothetical protein n=1 Tax=Pseudonocardia sp. GCM10023141 TaxID=3252653 RepID=UPI0036242060
MTSALVLYGLQIEAEPGAALSSAPAVAVEVARTLAGGSTAQVSVATPGFRDLRSAVAAADLVLVVTTGSGPLPRSLADRCASGLLVGKVTFSLMVGAWTDGAGSASAAANALSRAGATCLAPTLQLDPRTDYRHTIATYCRYWAPAVPALLTLAAESLPNRAAS